ncbi:hypothetical protein AJ80_08582 [Polytolypa hystricis UAMH7299]|uniref:Uncharacterized protein n=1 Tax=Polytolypa hystricis (strain UAMH7299) TaxID=1447883 RepID=A0A2B7X5I6_POLH7|nr:hypothetical protein AJ80_08582 [Polytolypa hystricis UAMH7299]
MALDFMHNEAIVLISVECLDRFTRGISCANKTFKPLHLAAKLGLHQIISPLLDNVIDLNAKDSRGRTPLSYAAECGHEAVAPACNGHTDVVKLLLAVDEIVPDLRDKYRKTPLSHAAYSGYEKVVELLLSSPDVNPHVISHRGYTPLFWAVYGQSEAVVKLWLDRQEVDLNYKNEYGNTAVCHAAAQGHVGILKLLLAKGADPEARGTRDRTPLRAAISSQCLEAVRLLLTSIPLTQIQKMILVEPLYSQQPPVLEARRSSNSLLQREGIDMTLATKRGRTAIYYAAIRGSIPCFELLYTPNVDANQRDNDGRTLLATTVCSENSPTVPTILRMENVDVNATDDDGRTPLSLAASEERAYALYLLLKDKGVRTDIADNKGWTALQ